jgi:hypothetical protein
MNCEKLPVYVLISKHKISSWKSYKFSVSKYLGLVSVPGSGCGSDQLPGLGTDSRSEVKFLVPDWGI